MGVDLGVVAPRMGTDMSPVEIFSGVESGLRAVLGVVRAAVSVLVVWAFMNWRMGVDRDRRLIITKKIGINRSFLDDLWIIIWTLTLLLIN